MGDENPENGLASGAISGREQDLEHTSRTPRLPSGFRPRSTGASAARDLPGDMDQIALMDILPAPQPRPAHPTAVQDVSKGALDQLPFVPA